MTPGVESLTLHTPDGVDLEAELVVPDDAVGAAVLCHPHPAQGGSMRSMITGHQFLHLPRHQVACLRFNFRGVGASGGSHSGGPDERIDVVSALDALHPIVEGLPLVLAGWSFGADTSLTVTDERLDGWCATAPPLRVFDPGDYRAGPDPRPKMVVVPEHDQFCPPEVLRPRVADWVDTTVVVAPGADHFLVGRLDDAVAAVVTLLGRLAAS